jgi:hypothetical protein
MTNPNEPTLTCSEVVERLAKDVADELLHKWPSSILSDEQVKKHIAEIVCMHATQRLHSWRERRVQELEECLRETAARLAATNVAIGQGLGDRMEDASGAEFWMKDYLANKEAIQKAERVYAGDEWREQIRKGAKHE